MNPSSRAFTELESQNYIFLDTEFTSLENSGELLSIGMVPMQLHLPELYLERSNYLRANCSDFVLKRVLPSFGRYPLSICTYGQMPQRIHAWSKGLGPGPHTLVCDSEKDVGYIWKLMGGYFPENVLSSPRVISGIAGDLAFEIRRLKFFQGLEQLQHHALHDARAIRFAYRAYFGLEA